MSTKVNDPAANFQIMAQKSLQAWQDMWTHAVGQAGAGAMPGAAGMADNEAATRVLDGLKGYVGWMENLGAASAATPGGVNWADALAQAFGGAGSQPFSEAFGQLPGMDQMDPQAWQQQFSKFMAPGQRAADAAFSLPAFGLAREQQEQSQALARAWAEYLQQSARYQALVARVGREAAGRVQDKLGEHEEPGRQIDSLRGLYNLWVDAAEDAWAEIAMSDEYREIYGAMTNAQMRVRQLVQQQTAEIAGQLGLPTRDEVDSLGRRLQELRRELASLRNTQRAASTAGHADKPATRSTRKPAASKAAGKKAPAASKTSKKKISAAQSKTARSGTRKSTRKSTVAKRRKKES